MRLQYKTISFDLRAPALFGSRQTRHQKRFFLRSTLWTILIVVAAFSLFGLWYGYGTAQGPEHSTAVTPPVYGPWSEDSWHKAHQDLDCQCGLNYLKVLAAATEEPRKGPVREREAVSPVELIRRAAEVAGEADIEKAKEITLKAIRECESQDANSRDCPQWLKAARGLKTMLESVPERKVFVNSIGMKMVRIPAGEYMMGSLKTEMDWLRLTFRKIWREGHKQWFEDELPLHPVRLTRAYFIGATEVTVGQFRQFVRETKHKTEAERGDGGMIFSKKENRWVPRKEMRWDNVPWQIQDNQPVVFVSWNDANAFCKWLSRKEKRTYRLPTEAEWERACRGGAVWARYPWGDRLPGDHDSNFGDGDPKLPESLTTVNDGYQYVAPVASYPPNGYGLYDMAGNVMEWVEDRYDRNYYENSPLEDPHGPGVGPSRVNKGGNWFASPADDRCAFRGFSGPEMSFWNLGFRVVMEESEVDTGTTTARAGSSDESERAKTMTPLFPPSEGEGMLLFRQAMFAAQQQRWEDSVRDLEAALKVYERLEDYLWIARVRATLAGIYAEQNRSYKAKELYTRALAEFRKVGDLGSARVVLSRLQELDTSPGVKVVEVQKGGVADRNGVVVGDIIIEYAGETGFKVDGFKSLVNDHARADKVTLSILNNEEISTLVVPGGSLGVAVEDIKRRPRPARPRETVRAEDDRARRRPPPRQGRARR
jgi:formylglycine-generating enzyme required for sulfatase activity